MMYSESEVIKEIKTEISNYISKEFGKDCSLVAAANKLCKQLPAAEYKTLKDFGYNQVISTWTAIQILKSSNKRYHKSDDYGEFI